MSRTDVILKRLLKLHPKLIDLTLDRVERLLGDLGRPQDRLPPTLHVAGTNGKYSVIAFLRAALEAAGHSVHVYSSPHLVRFNERIRLAGELVETRRLNRALEHCEAVNAGRSITYFEITTAAALTLFAESDADYLLLETGLGGRLDATNVIARPLGTMITPISIDHTSFLGDTIESIAAEKAGILKPGAPAVIGRQTDAARDVIEARCAALGVVPFVAGRDFDGYAQAGRLVYQDQSRLDDLPLPRLIGAHQVDNAVLAVAAIRHLRLRVGAGALGEGLQSARAPARLGRLGEPLAALLPRGSELWLDGAHNRAGAEALTRALADMNERRSMPLTVVAGMMGGRAAGDFFACFRGLANEVIAVPIAGESAAKSAAELAEAARAAGLEARAARGVPSALRSIGGRARRVVICGSLYLAGHVLALSKMPPD